MELKIVVWTKFTFHLTIGPQHGAHALYPIQNLFRFITAMTIRADKLLHEESSTFVK